MPRRDLTEAPKGPVARSATEALLDDLAGSSDTSSISVTSRKVQNARKSPIARPAPRRRGRPPLQPEQRTDHVKTTFSLPPETVGLIERLRTVPQLCVAGVPSKSDVVAEAVRRLAEATSPRP